MKHPLHPALVHFPVACWSLATLADAAGLLFPVRELQWFAAGLLLVGCVTGLAAAAAGLQQLKWIPAGHAAEVDAQRHMLLALICWCLYAGSLLLRFDHQTLLPAGGWALLLSGLGFGVLLVVGWLGGKLVYTHGVGGKAFPRPF